MRIQTLIFKGPQWRIWQHLVVRPQVARSAFLRVAKHAFTATGKARVQILAHLVRQNLLPERSTEVQSLQHRVAVAGVSELKQNEADGR